MADLRQLTDEALVVYVRSNDQEAYREVMRRYEKPLLRYAVSLVGDTDGAADAVQNAFIKAFINLKGFNARLKFSSWLYRIVHNEAINGMKKNYRIQSLESNPALLNNLSAATDIEKEYSDQEIKRSLLSCLNSLPLTYKEPLVLFYLENKAYADISDILRLPMGTVAVRMNRGKRLLSHLCKGTL